jgi:hypothetical protein
MTYRHGTQRIAAANSPMTYIHNRVCPLNKGLLQLLHFLKSQDVKSECIIVKHVIIHLIDKTNKASCLNPL